MTMDWKNKIKTREDAVFFDLDFLSKICYNINIQMK